MSETHELLEFWFGELDDRGVASSDAVSRWFKKSEAFDEEIRAKFGALRDAAMRGDLDHWLDSPVSTVALLVLLDQFSRNLGRDTPQMYEADNIALAAAKGLLASGAHLELGVDHASLVYMPLMHSESVEDQDRCVELFEELSARYPDIDRLRYGLDYAIKHRDIVARFGRFPHRNAILGRESTDEEIEFLAQPGSSF